MRRLRSVVRLLACLSVLAGVLGACASSAPAGGVHVLTADGAIGPVIANYIERGIGQAEDGDAQAVVIALDTPGGLDSSMREIIQRINTSTVPVVVYVAPSGARAASAGTFITMAAHVAAMAPNTAIGAAHPVSASGEDIGDDLGAKVENDAAAYIRSIAQARGRNADWAERAVRESISASASEAVDLEVVDIEASSLTTLLSEIDGREVTLADGRTVQLETADALVRENGMTLSERLLLTISDPNIAFLLLSLGSLALVLELLSPSGIGATVGILALVVAFFSLGTLPVNWAGVALVMLGAALLAVEIFVVSGGLVGVAGVGVMVFGGLFLTTSSQPQFEVARWLAVGLPAVIGAIFVSLMLFLLRTRNRDPQVGPFALVGMSGIARSDITTHDGWVSVRGERWQARLDAAARASPVAPGEGVTVTGVDGLQLTVRGVAPEQSRAASSGEPDEDAGGETQVQGGGAAQT